MSCPGCFEEGRRLLAQFEEVVKQAKEYAKQNNISTAIYKTEEGYAFINAYTAVELNIPFLQVVSVD